MDKLFNKIDQLFPVYKQFWKDIVAIETPSRNVEQLNKLVAFIADFASGRGFEVTVHPDLGMGKMLTVETAEGTESGMFTFMGHMDTVHPMGAFGEQVLWEEGDKLHGPGCIDCKGGLACAMLTMEALRETGYDSHKLKLIMNPDEEISTPTSRDFIVEQNKGAIALFNSETGTQGKLTVGRKSVYKVKVEVTGKAAHAGNNYFDGVSAIKECCHKILAIEALSKQGGTTYNCGVIHGGTVSNAVAESCWFEVDIRALTEKDMHEAAANVTAIAENCTLEGAVGKAILPQLHRPPFEVKEETMAFFEKIRKTALKYELEEFNYQIVGGGSDVVFAAMSGITAICSTGVCGTGTHSTREAADIPSLARRAKVMAAVITDYFAE